MSEQIEQAATRMCEYLAQDHDIDNTGDMESIYLFYGAGGPGSIEINMHELARAALDGNVVTTDAYDELKEAHNTMVQTLRYLTNITGNQITAKKVLAHGVKRIESYFGWSES